MSTHANKLVVKGCLAYGLENRPALSSKTTTHKAGGHYLIKLPSIWTYVLRFGLSDVLDEHLKALGRAMVFAGRVPERG